MDMTERAELVDALKFNVRENDIPYFSDEDLLNILVKNDWNLKLASYEALIMKAESTGLNVSGLTTKDSSSYFKMLAAKYRPNNTGILRGV